MPLRKQQFTIVRDRLFEATDVDDSRGRSVPVNMNFIEEGFLAKDTGVALFGATESTECHSLFHYQKKDGTSYFIRAKGTKLQVYSGGSWADHASSPTFTAGARFGYKVYDDELYFGNAVESLYKFDGTTFTAYASAPKGNILEVFEDRLFITGVSAEPLSVYYSNVGAPTTFSVADVLQPLGTDSATGLVNYFGQLLIFKQASIWRLTFVYDQVVSLFVPKLEVQNQNYGACSRKAIAWVENDVWFFNGREVRSIGFKDQQIGVLGVNRSVLSEPIKETLAGLSVGSYDQVVCFYYDRRFYLALPLSGTTNDTTFVCHLLHKNSWSKYTGRQKARALDFIEVDGTVYSATASSPYGTVRWDTSALNDTGAAIAASVQFRRVEDEDFSRLATYRYLDLMFKDLAGRVTVTVKADANDARTTTEKQFIVGNVTEDEEGAIGEVPLGQLLYGDSFGEETEYSPFVKKRVSFLAKAQSVTVGLANAETDETFTVAQFALTGHKQPRRQFASQNIVSM